MTNDFANIPAESEFRDAMTSTLEELGQDIADLAPELPIDQDTPLGEQLDQGCEPDCGWPGDGSGMDDLADYNQAEADDYRNE